MGNFTRFLQPSAIRRTLKVVAVVALCGGVSVVIHGAMNWHEPLDIFLDLMLVLGIATPVVYLTVLRDLWDSEEQWKPSEEIVTNSSDMICLIDNDLRYVSINPAYQHAFGLKREDMVGRTVASMWDPEFFKRVVLPPALRCLAGERVSYQNWATYPVLGRRFMDVTLSPYFVRGSICGYVVISRDITEHRQAEEALQASEARFRALIENSYEAITLVDANGTILYDSPAVTRILGYGPTERVGGNVLEFVEANRRQEMAEGLARFASAPGSVMDYEVRFHHKDGTLRDIEGVRKNLLHEPAVNAIVVNYRDVTERQRNAEALQRSQSLLSAIVQGTSDTIFAKDRESRYTLFNSGAEAISGKRASDVLGKDDSSLFSAAEARTLREQDLQVMGLRQTQVYQESLAMPGGPRREMLTTKGPLLDDNGNVVGLYGIAHDITEREQAARAIEMSEERLRLAQKIAKVGSWDWDLREGDQSWSDELFRQYDVKPGEITPSYATWLSFVHPDDRDSADRAVTDALNDGTPFSLELRMQGNLGREFIVRAEGSVAKDEEGAVTRFVAIQQDITERKRMEASLRDSDTLYRSLFEQAGDSIVVAEMRSGAIPVIVDVNEAAMRMHGYTKEEMIGKPVTFRNVEVSQQEAIDRTQILHRRGRVSFPAKHATKNGSHLEFEVYVTQLDVDGKQLILSIEHDITDRKRVEEELKRAAKIESIGVLAGGIAHDFNNILTGIYGNIQMAELYLGQGLPESSTEMLAEAGKAAMRAKALTQRLLTFSKGGQPVTRPIRIEALLRDSVDFSLRGSRTRALFAFDEDLWAIEADDGQIDQVLSNMVINAEQAMPEGGTIRVTARNAVIDDDRGVPLPAGQYVKIDIQDEGMGIPEEHQDRIFEPYFTTKQKGSGLGLASSYSVVRSHGGAITFESELGRGTTFHIYLPATQSPAVNDKPKSVMAGQSTQKARVLVLDDEEQIRRLLARVLRHEGYDVVTSHDGADTVDKYREAKGGQKPFDAVILDLTIPGGMGGKDVIGELLEIDPDVRAIVSSGYATDPIMANYQEYGFSGVVSKPYDNREMLDTVRSVLAVSESEGN